MVSALLPFVAEDEQAAFKKTLKQCVANAKAEVQRRASLYRRPDDQWEEDEDVPEGGRMVRAPELTWEGLLRNLKNHEEHGFWECYSAYP